MKGYRELKLRSIYRDEFRAQLVGEARSFNIRQRDTQSATDIRQPHDVNSSLIHALSSRRCQQSRGPVIELPNSHTRVRLRKLETREFLKLDDISLSVNTLLWLAYLFWDMKSAGMVNISWVSIVLYAVASLVLLGPGTTAGLGWLWRENIIAKRKHKCAITEESVKKQ